MPCRSPCLPFRVPLACGYCRWLPRPTCHHLSLGAKLGIFVFRTSIIARCSRHPHLSPIEPIPSLCCACHRLSLATLRTERYRNEPSSHGCCRTAMVMRLPSASSLSFARRAATSLARNAAAARHTSAPADASVAPGQLRGLSRRTRPLSTSRSLMRSGKNEPPQPIEDPEFVSIVDAPAKIVRARRRHGPGLILLGVYTIFIHFHRLACFVSCSGAIGQPSPCWRCGVGERPAADG
jgi:hypothetical protein